MTWREITDTAELDKRPYRPIAVLVACWYDGQFSRSFVCEAEYWGDAGSGWWGARGGGSLGQCVVTHWQPKPEPPQESDMLRLALRGVTLTGASR
jgi:hypothetical protein